MSDRNADRERQFDRIVQQYYEAMECGAPIDPQQLAKQYPEFRRELESFLADVQHLCETADASDRKIDPVHGYESVETGHIVRYIGEYRILGEIARGGMGVVFKARQEKLGRLVALKMILAGRHAGPADVERFSREARAAAGLRHANIVSIYEIGTHEGHPYFTMDFVEGESLAEKLRNGSLPAREAAHLVEKLARTVHFAHQQGVLHRDLKPGNILLDGDGEPYITDFGLAKNLLDGEQNDAANNITQTGQILGTPSYMAPEQAAAKHQLVSVSSDTYSLGAILYASVVGRPPFVAESSVETIRQVLEQEPLSVRTLNPHVPVDLETICQKCLEKTPSRRYTSAEELAEELHRFLEGKPIQARRISRFERTVRWCRRQPVAAALIATLLTLAVGGTWFGIERYQFANRQQEFLKTERDLRRHAERATYASDMQRAQRAWNENDVRATSSFVGRHKDRAYLHGFEWRYWLRRLNTERINFPVTLPGTAATTTQWISYSDDGGRIASVGAGWTQREEQARGSLVFWNSQNGEPLKIIKTEYRFNAVDWHPDGTRVVTSRPDNVIQIWDASTGEEQFTIGEPVDLYQTVSLPFEPGSFQSRISFDPVAQRNVVFSPDGRQLAAPARDYSVRLLNANNGELIYKFDGHSALVVRVAYSDDGRWLASGSLDGTVKIWDVPERKLWTTIPITRQSRKRGVRGFRSSLGVFPVAIDFHPDGNLIAMATTESEDVIWVHDVTNKQPLRMLVRESDSRAEATKTTDGVTSIEFSPDGSLLAAASYGQRVTMWRVNDWSQDQSFKGAYPVRCVAFRPDGREFASLGIGITVWDVQSSQAPRILRRPAQVELSQVQACAVSRDLRYVAGCSSSGPKMPRSGKGGIPLSPQNVDVWELETGRLMHSFPGHTHMVTWLQFLPNQYLLSGSPVRGDRNDQRLEVFVWDLQKGRRIAKHDLALNHWGYNRIAISDDGQRLAYANGRTVAVVDPMTGQTQLELPEHAHQIDSVSWLGTERLVVLHMPWKLKIWNIAKPKPVIALDVPVEGAGSQLAISPDEKWIAVRTSGEEVAILDANTGKERARVRGEDSQNRMVFSPDSKRLATVGSNAVWIWDVFTGREVLSLQGDYDSVMFGKDGMTLVAGSRGGLVVWQEP